MPEPANPYETPRLVADYLLFHYGTDDEVLPWEFGPRNALNFAVRCVSETFTRREEVHRALDVGCAVGRSSFELSKHAIEVIGIDYSHPFVAAASRLRAGETVPYARIEEGDITTRLEARLPQDVHAERVTFEQGDAMHLRPDLGTFDLVLAANLIDRLRDPGLFLQRAPSLVKPGGELVLTSPYTWLEDFTPRAAWLCGAHPDGARHTLDALQRILSPHFDLAATRDLPFLIREHARKYQWSVAQTSIWRKT